MTLHEMRVATHEREQCDSDREEGPDPAADFGVHLERFKNISQANVMYAGVW